MKSLALLLAAASLTQAAESDVTGLWQGSIDGEAIVACFDTSGFKRGSFYSRRTLVPQGIWYDDDTNTWPARKSGKKEFATWSIAIDASGNLSGNLRSAGREIPVRLTRMKWTKNKDDWEGPCRSVEYQAPRSFELVVKKAQKTLDDFEYETVKFVPPSHFAGNDIETFSYTAETPGDPAIVKQILANLPTGKPDDAFMQCMAGSTDSLGGDGYFSHGSRPVFANSSFISAEEGGSSFCGGAHPGHWRIYRVFDRASGEKLDLKRWFQSSGFAENKYGSVVITPELRSLVLEDWPQDADPECRDYVATADFWKLGLVPEGIAFLPSVAYALTPCGERMVVSWKDVTPFLSPEGTSARNRTGRR